MSRISAADICIRFGKGMLGARKEPRESPRLSGEGNGLSTLQGVINAEEGPARFGFPSVANRQSEGRGARGSGGGEPSVTPRAHFRPV